ncbi:MAG: hypothetical protein D6696_11905, partial [Acidobacteria bacterium]
MRPCVLGWFGRQNGGDDRIAEVLTRRLSGCHPSFLPFTPLPPEVVNYFDAVVLTAGVWQPRNRLAREFHRWCRGVHVPIVALGLGVEEVTPEMRAASAALVERCDFLWVRDRESKRLLGDHPAIVVGPDVTWADPLPAAGEPRPGVVALNLRRWRRRPWRPEAWVDAARRSATAELRPWSFGPEDWIVLHDFFDPCPKAFDAAAGRDAEIVAGMRLHSLIFAAQMGVPAVGIAYDPKCRRFLAELERPQLALDLDQADRLPQLVDGLRRRYAAEREHLAAIGRRFARRADELLAEGGRILRRGGAARRPPDLAGRALT